MTQYVVTDMANFANVVWNVYSSNTPGTVYGELHEYGFGSFMWLSADLNHSILLRPQEMGGANVATVITSCSWNNAFSNVFVTSGEILGLPTVSSNGNGGTWTFGMYTPHE